jgi:hypothetical protein
MTYTEDMAKRAPKVVIRRVANGKYLVVKDATGALGSHVTPSTALALRNELGSHWIWILPIVGEYPVSAPSPQVDPDAPRTA